MATSGALMMGVDPVPPMLPSDEIEKQPPCICASVSFHASAVAASGSGFTRHFQETLTVHISNDQVGGAGYNRRLLLCNIATSALDPIPTLLRGIACRAPGECSVIASVQTAMATIITFWSTMETAHSGQSFF
jgi:hypothetical protein